MVQAVFGAFVQRVNGNMDEVNPQPDDVWFLKGGTNLFFNANDTVLAN